VYLCMLAVSPCESGGSIRQLGCWWGVGGGWGCGANGGYYADSDTTTDM
jgi:hypothetical protein